MAPLGTGPRRLVIVLGAALLASIAPAAPAAANTISPESPASPGAEDIGTLYWIGLVAVILIAGAINVALVFATIRFRARRGHEPRPLRGGRAPQIRATAALGVLATALFVLGIIYTESASDTGPAASGVQVSATSEQDNQATSGEPVAIQATGQQWIWRYQYPNGAFSYHRLVVPVDTPIELDFDSTDVVHRWFVPALGIKADAVPGRINTVSFLAEDEDDYEGASTAFSGPAYAAMRTRVSVVSQDRYKRFVEDLLADIQEAQDEVTEKIAAAQGEEAG